MGTDERECDSNQACLMTGSRFDTEHAEEMRDSRKVTLLGRDGK